MEGWGRAHEGKSRGVEEKRSQGSRAIMMKKPQAKDEDKVRSKKERVAKGENAEGNRRSGSRN